MNRGDLFKGVIQWEMMTKDLSLEGKLPVFYYDNTSMTATLHRLHRQGPQSFFPCPICTPVEAMAGRALVAFTAFEYRKTDIDPYNEFSISFPITYPEKGLIPGITVLGMMAKKIFYGIRLAASRHDRAGAQGRRGHVRVSQIHRRHQLFP
ncbi:MAG: hypothetical protein M0C28_36005 [Candidatus Moduliflexus flocculans]|nr:hypothetical protein [Candidatus Moduliflexus flocculans]